MRIVSHPAVRALALALLLGFCPERGHAGGRDEDLFIRPDDQRTVIFAGADAGGSVFVSGGSKQTLTGPLDKTGFVVMETSGFGITRERFRGEVDLPALRFTTQSAVLLGHQWNLDRLFLAMFVGPELQHEQLTITGRVYSFSEPRYGVRGQFELWSNPTPDTLLTGTVVAGSTRANLWARASAGYRLAGDVFVGPEVTSYTTVSYQETKVGAHLTGWKVGLLQGRLSAGWSISEDGRGGSPYVGLSAWIRM